MMLHMQPLPCGLLVLIPPQLGQFWFHKATTEDEQTHITVDNVLQNTVGNPAVQLLLHHTDAAQTMQHAPDDESTQAVSGPVAEPAAAASNPSAWNAYIT